MRTVTYRLVDLQNATLNLGHAGENQRTRIMFDAKKLFEEYPAALPSLTVKPPVGDTYPAVVTKEGYCVYWDITDSDLIHDGIGEAQLTFTENDVKVKTYITKTKITRSLDPVGQIPTPIENWIERADGILDEAQEAAAAAESAAQHQPKIENGYWYVWNGTEYVQNVKAQGEDGAPGQDGKDGKDGADGQPGADGRDGVDATPALITVDYEDLVYPVAAGTTCYHSGEMFVAKEAIQTAGAWDSSKWDKTTVEEQVGQLKNAIQGKYTLPSGGIPDTDLSSGIQTSLGLANTAYQKPSGGIPALDIAEGVIPTVPTVATQAQIKGGTDDLHPIAPIYQHESVFYALAKLAGADMASLSPVTVGQFPDAQKTAIQKMLGIYESPWELIRADTVTNATEADVEITVDWNGASFELTDVYLQVWTPQQETAASIGDFGRVQSYYGNYDIIVSQMGTWTQSANASAKYGQVLLTNKNGAIRNEATQNATQYTLVSLTSRTNLIAGDALLKIGTYSFEKITIKKVTGTVKYNLYGKRKWN